MKVPGSLARVAVVAAAIVAGALLDRLLFPRVGASTPETRPPVSAGHANAIAILKDPSTPAGRVTEDEKLSADMAPSRKSLDTILALPDPRQRTRDLQALISALGPNEFADALKRIRLITSSNERELASRLLISHWVQTDPDGALQFAAANRGFAYLAEDVFQQRAAADFQSALSSAQEIPGSDLRYRALRGVLRSKADADPAGAIQLAQTLGDYRGNEPLSNVLYREWAANDPRAAALYAAQQGKADDGWRSPVLQVVNTWAQQDPLAAANWALLIPDAEAQARSISQVMRDWSRQDPTATANWIYSLPAGAQRDNAVAGLAQSMVFADPQAALGWIATITDDIARQRVLQRVSREVMARDPQNGSALLQAAGLPANQINQPGRRRGPGRP